MSEPTAPATSGAPSGAPGLRSWRAGLSLGLVGWAVGVALGQAGVSRAVDAPVYDAYVRRLGPLPPEPRVARVYVGDRDVAANAAELGRWPWSSRSPHVRAFEAMRSAGVTAVGCDIFFVEPVLADSSDDDLAIEMADLGTVVLGVLFQTDEGTRWGGAAPTETQARVLAASEGRFGTDPGATDVPAGRSPALPIDTLADAATALGHCNGFADPDQSIRRVALFVRDGDALHPSLSLRLAMAALGAGNDDVTFDPAAREIRIAPPGAAVVRVPVDPTGAMWVRYGRPLDRIEGFQYGDLGLPEVRRRLAGRVVLLGASITGSSDLWRTPMAERFPGFLVHAQVVEDILAGTFVTAVEPDRFPAGTRELAVHAALLLLCAGLGVLTTRLEPRAGWPVTLAAAASPFALSWFALSGASVWLGPATPAFAAGSAAFLGALHHQFLDLRERARVRRVFERYLAPTVLDAVLRSPDLMRLGGRRRELTVFFSDIRGFTPYSETVEPEELTARLNEYYGEMIGVAHAHGATVDKLIGDCLMTFFNDPLPQPDHAMRAVRMAVAMRDRLEALAAASRREGRHVFACGMGIATGNVVVGNLGSEGFVDYTVVGRVVNLAARLQAAAGPGEILVSRGTHDLVREHVVSECLGEQQFKGIAAAEEVHRVIGLGGAAGVAGPAPPG